MRRKKKKKEKYLDATNKRKREEADRKWQVRSLLCNRNSFSVYISCVTGVTSVAGFGGTSSLPAWCSGGGCSVWARSEFWIRGETRWILRNCFCVFPAAILFFTSYPSFSAQQINKPQYNNFLDFCFMI